VMMTLVEPGRQPIEVVLGKGAVVETVMKRCAALCCSLVRNPLASRMPEAVADSSGAPPLTIAARLATNCRVPWSCSSDCVCSRETAAPTSSGAPPAGACRHG
jgi:hypothetical protein